jgi:hypothetical protein
MSLIVTVIALARQLFPSFDSATLRVASAQAIRRYAPAEADPGTPTTFCPDEAL